MPTARCGSFSMTIHLSADRDHLIAFDGGWGSIDAERLRRFLKCMPRHRREQRAGAASANPEAGEMLRIGIEARKQNADRLWRNGGHQLAQGGRINNHWHEKTIRPRLCIGCGAADAFLNA